MFKWKVKGRVGRKVRDEDREEGMEEELLPSARAWVNMGALHLGAGRAVDIAAGQPLQKTKPGDVWHCQSGC